MDKATFEGMCIKTRDHVFKNSFEYAGKPPKEIMSLMASKAVLFWVKEFHTETIAGLPEIEVWESGKDYCISISYRNEGLQMVFGLEKTAPLISAKERYADKFLDATAEAMVDAVFKTIGFHRVDVDTLESLRRYVLLMYERAHEGGLIDSIPTITGRYNETTGEPEIIITHDQKILQVHIDLKIEHTENPAIDDHPDGE